MSQQEIIEQKELLQSKLDAGAFPPSIEKAIEKRIADLNEMITA